ncbi:hypothetical protein GIB67_022670 [Kingdonia uniflora]|uniref:Uncharacterized protein n=1 Tax=Kingdonia uniflora TaxID=39325 RepID=A0A7J7P906_9MAGN|nr:hypothetical protein GIB67_022670 [Kingdonia uniflora]
MGDDPVGQAYGPEKKGRVRGEGILVTKSMLKHMKHARTIIKEGKLAYKEINNKLNVVIDEVKTLKENAKSKSISHLRVFDWIGTCLDGLEEDCQDVRDATNRCNEILYCTSEHSSKGCTSERNLQADPKISENGWKRCFSKNGWKECNNQFHNGMHLPLVMGGAQQGQPISWIPDNDGEYMMLSEDPNLLPQRGSCKYGEGAKQKTDDASTSAKDTMSGKAETNYEAPKRPISIPVLLPYHGMSEEEAAEAEEDYYSMWRFYFVVLTGEACWRCLRILAEDKVEETDVGDGITAR